MKTPKRIEPLVEEGLVDSVICQLMSGKEAMIYLVRCGEKVRCAKVYKEHNQRNFRQNIHYTEGRKIKNSRRARAIKSRLLLICLKQLMQLKTEMQRLWLTAMWRI